MIQEYSRTFIVVKDYNTDKKESINPNPPVGNSYQFIGTNNIEGAVLINLYEDYDGETLLFGRIFLFDLGCLEYTVPSSISTSTVILENKAIIVENDGTNTKMKKEPQISFQQLPNPPPQAHFSCRMILLRSSQSSYSGGSGTLRFSTELQENYVREILPVAYNVSIQVYGDHASTWLQYFKQTQGFSKTDDDHRLSLGGMSTSIVFTQSIFKVEFT
jgi:hypothetical protein